MKHRTTTHFLGRLKMNDHSEARDKSLSEAACSAYDEWLTKPGSWNLCGLSRQDCVDFWTFGFKAGNEHEFQRFAAGCLILEREITLEGRIGWQEQRWHLFRWDGESLGEGQSIMELIVNLSEKPDTSLLT